MWVVGGGIMCRGPFVLLGERRAWRCGGIHTGDPLLFCGMSLEGKKKRGMSLVSKKRVISLLDLSFLKGSRSMELLGG